jgi:hypothetical protein
LPEPAGAATRAHGGITAAMAAPVARPLAANPGARGSESDDESTGEVAYEGRGGPTVNGDDLSDFLE